MLQATANVASVYTCCTTHELKKHSQINLEQTLNMHPPATSPLQERRSSSSYILPILFFYFFFFSSFFFFLLLRLLLILLFLLLLRFLSLLTLLLLLIPFLCFLLVLWKFACSLQAPNHKPWAKCKQQMSNGKCDCKWQSGKQQTTKRTIFRIHTVELFRIHTVSMHTTVFTNKRHRFDLFWQFGMSDGCLGKWIPTSHCVVL